MADNLAENPKNPLNLPKKITKPRDFKSYPEGRKEDEDHANFLARQGGSGGKSLDVPTFQRNEQEEFPKLPKAKPPLNISKN